jgi:hypothetical protein
MHRAKRHCGLLLAASVWVDAGVVRTASAKISADVCAGGVETGAGATDGTAGVVGGAEAVVLGS